MAAITKRPAQNMQRLHRIWKSPTSRARFGWLLTALAVYIPVVTWYVYTIKTRQSVAPIDDPLRLFGIAAYVLILGTVAYTLRRRFVRGLPGKVQNWLWMHTWIGISTILIVVLHENFASVTHDFCTNFTCLTGTYWAFAALFALILLVVSGITGRLIDTWQTHIIAREANANGVGITRALEERILELEYTIERLCAGKTEPFKQYCLQAIDGKGQLSAPQAIAGALPKQEWSDFQRASEMLTDHARLTRSLQRQRQARRFISMWRTIHMMLATVALLIISYHAIMELLTNVFHVIHSG